MILRSTNFTQIEKHKFRQHKCPTSIKNININKIIVFNKVSFGKKVFNLSTLLVKKMLKKLDADVYFFQKWVHI